MCQCNYCDNSEQVKDVVDTLFSMGILMAEARKEKENEKWVRSQSAIAHVKSSKILGSENVSRIWELYI